MANQPIMRLATKKDELVKITPPVSTEEIADRQEQYHKLTPGSFAKRYRGIWNRPVTITYQGKEYAIQVNSCTNPFCKWYAMEQGKLPSASERLRRYKLNRSEDVNIICNSEENPIGQGVVLKHRSQLYSNWSIAEEIARLVTNDTVLPRTPTYSFHHPECPNYNDEPITCPQKFYKWGVSKSNSPRWKCRECNKITNILPKKETSYSYHQKRNDILPSLVHAVLGRSPVKRTINALGIGSKTYYSKLERLYQSCLEFLERHEKTKIPKLDINTLWLNTDQLVYNLNEIRQKRLADPAMDDNLTKKLETNIIATADLETRYVFRADVAFDWQTSFKDIAIDTELLKEDHLELYEQKNARLRTSFKPQPPSKYDTESEYDAEKAILEFERRERYIDGLHVNSSYTAYAHYWLLKRLINVKNWRFVSDYDGSLTTALFRVFKEEIRNRSYHHFDCRISKDKSIQDSRSEFMRGMYDLREEAGIRGMGKKGDELYQVAFQLLKEDIGTFPLYEYIESGGALWPNGPTRMLQHPIPTNDQGFRHIRCLTNLTGYDNDSIAKMFFHVNTRATDSFFQEIRRRINILERPLVTARQGEKSYIYANINPKYAQYAVTLLRTIYNYCEPFRSKDHRNLTPAQRLGLVNRVCSIEDIIYFK